MLQAEAILLLGQSAEPLDWEGNQDCSHAAAANKALESTLLDVSVHSGGGLELHSTANARPLPASSVSSMEEPQHLAEDNNEGGAGTGNATEGAYPSVTETTVDLGECGPFLPAKSASEAEPAFEADWSATVVAKAELAVNCGQFLAAQPHRVCLNGKSAYMACGACGKHIKLFWDITANATKPKLVSTNFRTHYYRAHIHPSDHSAVSTDTFDTIITYKFNLVSHVCVYFTIF